MDNPGFLIGHGPRGRASAARAEALLKPTDTVRLIESPEATEPTLAEIAPVVPGGSVLRVVHLVEVEDDAIRLGLAGAASAVDEVMRRYPAVSVKQYVVALVDREWDDNERVTLLELEADVASVLVVSRSNEAAVQLLPVEEECMASDVACALLLSDLAEKLEEDRFWLVGTSAVYYRRWAVIEALVAYHVGRFLRENLLKDLPASYTECEEGKAWIRSRNLGVAEHLLRLGRSPMGGSVIGEIKLDHDLFRRVPPELLVDSLRSFVVQSSDRLFDEACEQIKRNRAEHFASETAALTAAVLAILRRSLVISLASRYLGCARAALDGPIKELQIALSAARVHDEETLREQQGVDDELNRTIRHLPYRAAMVARTLGLGTVGVAGYHALGAWLSFDPNFALLGLVLGVLLGSPLVIHYRRILGRISALRERYLALAEQRIRDRVALCVLEMAAGELQELGRFAGVGPSSVGSKLDALRELIAELTVRYEKLIEDRTPDALPVTRFSVLLPTGADMSTEALAETVPLAATTDIPALVMRCILADGFFESAGIEALEAALFGAISPGLEGAVWRDLAALLRSSGDSADTVAALVAARTAPIVRRDELALDVAGVRRMAVGSEDLASLLEQTQVQGRLRSDDRNTLVQLALRRVPEAMCNPGGGDGGG